MSTVDDYDELPERPSLTPAARRQRRQTTTLLILCGLLLAAFLFAAAYYEGWFGSGTPAAAAPCVTPTATAVQPSQIRVNVYNATKRNGLAAGVASQLHTRGFVIGKVANDPLDKAVTTPAQVRYGAKGRAGATLVEREVTGAKLVLDKRKDATVDLVLGDSYAKLADVTPTSSSSPSATCTPSTTATTGATSTVTATTTTKATKTKK